MSKVIQVVFVHGIGGISPVIEFIEELDNADKDKWTPTHCGLIVDGVFQEALASGFIGNKLERYKPEQLRIYDIVIDDEDKIKAGDARFKELLGQKYSVKALIDGAAYSVFGLVLTGTQGENDCSGDDTDILRTYGLDIKGDVPASSITPEILMEVIEQIGTLHVDAA